MAGLSLVGIWRSESSAVKTCANCIVSCLGGRGLIKFNVGQAGRVCCEEVPVSQEDSGISFDGFRSYFALIMGDK